MSSAASRKDVFARPWFRELFGAVPGVRRHPYPRDLFLKHEVFPLFLLDSGAWFWLHDQVGGKADGRAILDALASGRLLAPWMRDGEMDWDLPMKTHGGSRVRVPLESVVWINRLYFLLPLAQEYLRTSDEKWARLWMRFFTDWSERHPCRGRVVDPSPGDFVWFDMQVSWRLLVLIHSVHLLARSRRITRREWESIYHAIELHADHALEEARKELAQGGQGANHSLLRGAALLYAGALFPELKHASGWVDTGKTVIAWQMREQLLPDGGSAEGSPSYSHFIARQYVDAFVLMQKNGIDGIDGLPECIQRQYEWLHQASSPEGKSLQVGDSYALDAETDLAIVSRLFPLKLSARKTSVHFKESGFAILRNARVDLYVDAMKLREDHQHLGRPNLLLFVDRLPLVVDSGCHNYDRLINEHYLRSAFAHNVVLVPELQEESLDVYMHPAELRQRYSRITITDFMAAPERSQVTTAATIQRGGIEYTWERKIILEVERVRIVDTVVSETEVLCQQLFHLAPLNVLLLDGGRTAVVRLGARDVLFEHIAGPASFTLHYAPAMDGHNDPTYSPTLVSEARGTRCGFEVQLSLGGEAGLTWSSTKTTERQIPGY